MNTVLWIVAAVLALLFAFAGFNKIAQSHDKLSTMLGDWVQSFAPAQIKLLGAVEVLGAIGLVLPQATDTAQVLTPLAAVGLALVMVGAVLLHARRKELQGVVMTVVLLALALFVAIGRF